MASHFNVREEINRNMALPYLYDVCPSETGLELWHSGKLEPAPRRIASKLAFDTRLYGDPARYDLVQNFLPFCNACAGIIQLHTSGGRPGWGDSWLRVWARGASVLTKEAQLLLPFFVEAFNSGTLTYWQKEHGEHAEVRGLEVTTWKPRNKR